MRPPAAEPGAAPASAWLVDKPPGPSSHDVVATARRAVGRGVKVGHAGTLDPFATGVLVVLVGRATRLTPYLSGLDKTYEADIRLGAVSASGDPEGPITETGTAPAPDALARELDGLTGPQRQRVPALAAVKVGGEPLYRRTRRGELVEAPVRDVVIHGITLRAGPDRDGVASITVRCSKGTYIRQLAADIGELLGCGAYCTALRRTRVGDLPIEEAVAPNAVRAEGGVGLLRALAHLPTRTLTPADAADMSHGRPIAGDEEGLVALAVDHDLAAVARGADGVLRPEVVVRVAA